MSGLHSVLVTGGTGYVATELIKQLLCKGYDVTATVRNPTAASAATLKTLGVALPGTPRSRCAGGAWRGGERAG